MTLASVFPHPIIQGPMAGGNNTPAQVAAVSNTGALGSLACSLLSPQAIREQTAQIRAPTDQPFCLNFFVLQTPNPSVGAVEQAKEWLKPAWSSLGWTELPTPAKWCEDFSDQFETLLALRPAVASFTFGILSAEQIRSLQAAGIFVIGTITHVEKALAWESRGADAVIASGVESGIHPAYKQRLLTAGEHPTRLTRTFSGRENRFMQLMAANERLYLYILFKML